MLSEILKKNTQQSHQELESLLIQKIRNLDSITAYVKFLKKFYGYVAAVEEQVNTFINKELIPNYEKRRKADDILDDILAFEPESASVTLATDLPNINSNEAALGAMYVLEGSTLGGQHISRMIMQKLNIDSSKGFCFFNGYREHTEAMWTEFKDGLNRAIQQHQEQLVCDSANQTFIKFKKWIDEH